MFSFEEWTFCVTNYVANYLDVCEVEEWVPHPCSNKLESDDVMCFIVVFIIVYCIFDAYYYFNLMVID